MAIVIAIPINFECLKFFEYLILEWYKVQMLFAITLDSEIKLLGTQVTGSSAMPGRQKLSHCTYIIDILPVPLIEYLTVIGTY